MTDRVRGRVKWFDLNKGFGFVLCDEGGSDVLLHANVLRNFGQSSVVEGAFIDLEIQQTDRGVQAVLIHEIRPPEGTDTPGLADFEDIDPELLRNAPLVPARIKWFDKAKGFGFANTFGDPGDVFLHIEVLRRCGLADLQAGEALAIRVIEGKRGRMATEVSAWETAIK